MADAGDEAPPPVGPVLERARDFAIAAGGPGSVIGACVAARHEASILTGVVALGGGTAALAAAFIGLRHALLQDRWEQDSEVVSAFAAGALGGTTGLAFSTPTAGVRVGILSFVGGGMLHYAHRWWLHFRLKDGW